MISFPELKANSSSADFILPIHALKEGNSEPSISSEKSQFQALLEEVRKEEKATENPSNWKPQPVQEEQFVSKEEEKVDSLSDKSSIEEIDWEKDPNGEAEEIEEEKREELPEETKNYLLDRFVLLSERNTTEKMEKPEISETVEFLTAQFQEEDLEISTSSTLPKEEKVWVENSISNSKLETQAKQPNQIFSSEKSELPKEIKKGDLEKPKQNTLSEGKSSKDILSVEEKFVAEIKEESPLFTKKTPKSKESKSEDSSKESKPEQLDKNSIQAQVVNVKELLGENTRVQKVSSKKEDFSSYEMQKMEMVRQREVQVLGKTTTESFSQNSSSGQEQKSQNENFFSQFLRDTFKLNGKSSSAKSENVNRSESFYKNLQELVKSANFHIIENGKNSARIELNPKDLGRLTLKVVVENDKLDGKIFVENESAKNLVLSDISTLKEELKSIGLELQTITIDLESKDSENPFNFVEDRQNEETGLGNSNGSTSEEDSLEESNIYRKDPTKMIDIRV
jgi:flagellar hook-length control protein FliK